MSANVEILPPAAIAVDLTPEEEILVRRGRDALRRSHQEIIEFGKVLAELKDVAGYGRFGKIVDQHFGIDRNAAAMFMRLANHAPFANVATVMHLPASPHALDRLRSLNDQQFEAGIANGDIHEGMTVRDAEEVTQRYLGKQITRPETVETGAAWNDLAKKMHRPQAVARYGSPSAPKGAGATTISELMFLLIERRHALGLSQAAMDDIVGWAEGLCSKYEILHHDEGRAPSIDAVLEYAQGLKCGLQVVALT